MELPSHHRPKQVFHGRLGDKTTDFRGVYFGLANFCPRGSPFKERLLKRRKADRWKGTSKTANPCSLLHSCVRFLKGARMKPLELRVEVECIAGLSCRMHITVVTSLSI